MAAANLDRDPASPSSCIDPGRTRTTSLEVRGTAAGDHRGRSREHIDALSGKYIGKDYPWLGPGEQRKKFVITPEKVRYVKQ